MSDSLEYWDKPEGEMCKDPLCNAVRAGIPHVSDAFHAHVLETAALYRPREYGRKRIMVGEPVRKYTALDWRNPWIWLMAGFGVTCYVVLGYLVMVVLRGV